MKNWSKKNIAGTTLIASILGVNAINLFFNVYLGRVLSFEEFGLLTLINTFLFLALIPFNALSATANHHIAYHTGKNEKKTNMNFLISTKKKTIAITLTISLFWILLIPVINNIFHINDLLVPLLFSPIIILGAVAALNRGFLQGSFNFNFVSLILILEASSKFIIAWILINFNLHHSVYISIPLSVSVAYLLSNHLILKQDSYAKNSAGSTFPKKFFFAALISGISSMAFFSFDLLLAKHFLSPTEAGQYALLSLVGKMVYFLGILPSYLMITFISNDEGNNRNPRYTFYKLFIIALILTTVAFIAVAPLGKFFFPFIFGDKVFTILQYVYLYSAGIAFLTLGATITSFHIAKKQYLFPIVAIFIAFIMSIGIIFFHKNIHEIVQVIFFTSLLGLGITIALHILEATNLIYE